MIKSTFVIFLLCLVSNFVFAGTEVVKGDKECNTITVEGSFFKGKTFKATVNVSGATTADAIKRTSQALVADGWKIATADEKLGVITADTTVSYGSGKTAPLGVTMLDKEGGLLVKLSYAVSGGTGAKTSDVGHQFCMIVDAIEGK